MKKMKWAGGLLLMALLLSRPQAAAQAAARAMAHWYAAVAPSVFPFLALMPLLTCREAARVYERALGRAMGALFDLPGAAAPAMVIGMVAGTPAGAIAARSVAVQSGMNRGQLDRLALASMGFSPAFLVSGVGAGLLGSPEAGWRLAGAQLMTQLTLALLLRGAWRGRTSPVSAGGPVREESPVRGAALAALTICGYMALFAALAGAAGAWLGGGAAGALLCLLDVPSGARVLSEAALDAQTRLVLLAAICGFGGACVITQLLAALGDGGPGVAEAFGLRSIAGAINAGWMALGLRLGKIDVPGFMETFRVHPLAFAGLCASLLAVPAILQFRKSIS